MIMRLDAVSFNYAEMPIDRIESLLFDGHKMGFNHVSKRHLLTSAVGEVPAISPLGVYYKPKTGCINHPTQVQFQGVGCTRFANILPVMASQSDFHISRLDFCFDYLMSKSEWKDICMIAEDIGFSDQKFKKVVPVGAGYEKTIYIGSRQSPFFFRIYNKTLEDPQYQYLDDEGHVVDIPAGIYVIRYELELKRANRHHNGVREVVDPTPLFDLYYSHDTVHFEKLLKYIGSLWFSYAEKFLPFDPSDFSSDFFVPYWSVVNNGYFVQSSDDPKFEEVIQTSVASLYSYPQTFDSKLLYVAEHYGSYVPYILTRPDLFELCKQKCKIKFGFCPPIDVVDLASEGAFSDILEDDFDIPPEFESLPSEQFSIDNFDLKGGYNQWS